MFFTKIFRSESRSIAVQCDDRPETGDDVGERGRGGGSILTTNHSDLSGSFEEIVRTEFTGDGEAAREFDLPRQELRELDVGNDEENRDLEVTSTSGDIEMLIEGEEDSVASSIGSHPYVASSPTTSAYLPDLTDLR